MKIKVAVGLSGGVDSSFAAYLLTKQGFNVVGFTLKFFPEENRCCDLESLEQAKRLCYKLDIPHYVIDVKELFKKEIINYFIESYLKGLTPNPCAYCNRLIKFGYFLNKIKLSGINYLATGHYARQGQLKSLDRRSVPAKNKNTFFIESAKDTTKSQEYFLALIKPEALPYLIFPLADYKKEQVKKEAKKAKIIFKERGESQDVCFIKEDYPKFIKDNIPNEDYGGQIRHIKGGILGMHQGIYHFTCGQRSGLGIKWKEPLYVLDIDAKSKDVIVGEEKYIYRDRFNVESCNWFICPEKIKKIKVKVRYNCPRYNCSLEVEGNQAKVKLDRKISAIAAGQIAAFYAGNRLFGGGIIVKSAIKN